MESDSPAAYAQRQVRDIKQDKSEDLTRLLAYKMLKMMHPQGAPEAPPEIEAIDITKIEQEFPSLKTGSSNSVSHNKRKKDRVQAIWNAYQVTRTSIHEHEERYHSWYDRKVKAEREEFERNNANNPGRKFEKPTMLKKICLKSKGRTLGWDWVNEKYDTDDILEYDSEVKLEDFAQYIVTSQYTGNQDVYLTLEKLLARGAYQGLDQRQMGELLKQYIKVHLPTEYFAVQNTMDPETIFKVALDSVNYATMGEKCVQAIKKIGRGSSQDSLPNQTTIYLAIRIEMLLMESPSLTDQEAREMAETETRRIIPMLLSSKMQQYLAHLKETMMKTGGTLTFEEEMNSIIKQEAVPGFQLTKPVNLANWTRSLGDHELDRIADVVAKRDVECNLTRVRAGSSSASGRSDSSRSSSYDRRSRRRPRRGEKSKSGGRWSSYRGGRDRSGRRGQDSSASSRWSSTDRSRSRYSNSSTGRSRSRNSSMHSAYSTDASSGREDQPCFACGEKGHMYRDCRKHGGKLTKDLCSKCKKGKHSPAECKLTKVSRRRRDSSKSKGRDRSKSRSMRSNKAETDRRDHKRKPAKAYKSDVDKRDKRDRSVHKADARKERKSGSSRRSHKAYKTDVDRRRRRSQSDNRSKSPYSRRRNKDSRRSDKSAGKR